MSTFPSATAAVSAEQWSNVWAAAWIRPLASGEEILSWY